MSRVMRGLKFKIVDNAIKSVRFSVNGNTGEHLVAFLPDTEADTTSWHCSCQGFSTHKHCRHVKAGNIVREKLNEALELIQKGEERNWKQK